MSAAEPEGGSRHQRQEWRRRRRRRRVVRGFVRLAFWTLLLAGVFVFGLGFGRTVGGGADGETRKVTIERARGPVTATQPVTTVVETQTKTVVKIKPARAQKRG